MPYNFNFNKLNIQCFLVLGEDRIKFLINISYRIARADRNNLSECTRAYRNRFLHAKLDEFAIVRSRRDAIRSHGRSAGMRIAHTRRMHSRKIEKLIRIAWRTRVRIIPPCLPAPACKPDFS